MRRVGKHCLAMTAWGIVLTFPLSAQEPPIVGQPANFSQVVGTFRIAAAADPVEIMVEQPLTLTVTITGQAVGKYVPHQKTLKIFPEDIDQSFFVEPRGEKSNPDGKTWEIFYRLRPKNTEVEAIPSLRLTFFSPARRVYQTTSAPGIPIKVLPLELKPGPETGASVVNAPRAFFELDANPCLLTVPVSHPVPRLLNWVVLLAVPPIVGWLVYILYPRICPDRETIRRRQRSEAVRRVLRGLQSSTHAEAIFALVTAYLQARLHWPVKEPTGSEVAQVLKKHGVSSELQRQFAEFFQRCAADRFHAFTETHDFPREADRLIQALENDPCWN